MEFKCDTVGLPNVRKLTPFNALTRASTGVANLPFCTIEPNTGAVSMPDPRLNRLTEIAKPQHTFLAAMEFVDIVGLVKGASKDGSLGSQLLTNTRETEVIGHVVRCLENDNIIHVSGKASPADGIEAISTELVLVDFGTCERVIHHIQKKAKDGDKDTKTELAALEKRLPQLESVSMLRALDLSAEGKVAIRYLNFLTLKPIMYVANVNKDGFENNPYLDQVREIATKEGSAMVPVCVAIEVDITGLDGEERGEFMQEFGLGELDLNRVIRADYKLLNLQTYFVAGTEEVRAWTIPVGATAPQAAGKVHTDFEKGFIRAQTTSLEDFTTYKDEQGMGEAGKMCAKGKDYIAKNGDVMNFLFNA